MIQKNTTKHCNKCKLPKVLSDFYVSKSSPDGYINTCKTCKGIYARNRQHLVTSEHRASLRAARIVKNRAKTVDYYGGKLICNNCGLIDDNFSVYDFHHIEEKTGEISKLMQCSWSKLKAELSKCIPLCANCHRRVHNPKEVTDV